MIEAAYKYIKCRDMYVCKACGCWTWFLKEIHIPMFFLYFFTSPSLCFSFFMCWPFFSFLLPSASCWLNLLPLHPPIVPQPLVYLRVGLEGPKPHQVERVPNLTTSRKPTVTLELKLKPTLHKNCICWKPISALMA